MRKGCDGEEKKTGGKKRGKKTGKKREKKIRMKIVATTSLPAVDRRTLERCTLAPITFSVLSLGVGGLVGGWVKVGIKANSAQPTELKLN